MTAVRFITDNGKLISFDVSGHCTSDADDSLGKEVCAAVSSAAYMTANTLSEIIGAKLDASVSDGDMSVMVLDKIGESQTVLEGFRLHITELGKQYKSRIKVVSEV